METDTDTSTSSAMQLTEVGLIPEDWGVYSISTFSEKVGSGITPTGGTRVYKDDGRFFIRSQNVGWGTLLLSDVVFIDEITHQSFSSTEIKEGDVLLNITGASIGRCAIANYRIEGGNVNQHVCIIRVNSDLVDSSFLAAVILSRIGQNQIDSFQAGGNRQGLNFTQIRSIQILLPPTKAEQTAIATALGDADALIERLEQLIAKKRLIKQGAMQELLTPLGLNHGLNGLGDDTDGEGEAQQEIRAIRQSVPISGSDNWEVKTLGEVADIDKDNLDSSTDPNYSFKYIALEDVSYGTLKNTTEMTFKDAPSRARRRVKKDDVLISTVRPNLKSHLLVDSKVKNLVCSTGFSLVTCKRDVLLPKYLFHHLFADFINNQIEAVIAGSNYPAINSKDVKSLTLPIPKEVRIQEQIAQILSDMDTEIERLEAQLAKWRRVKEGMMQCLLTGQRRLIV